MTVGIGDGQRAGVVQVSIDLAPEVHDELQAVADVEGTTLAELVERAIALQRFCSQRRAVPLGASLVPDHPICRAQGHQGLRFAEETERMSATGTRARLVSAQCSNCGRDQAQVRAVYPPEHTITVTPPTADPEPADAPGAPESNAGR